MTLTIRCRPCNGKGRVGFWRKRCPDCLGRGWWTHRPDMWEGEPRESWRDEDGWAKDSFPGDGTTPWGVVEGE